MSMNVRLPAAAITALFATAGLSACVIKGDYFETGSHDGLACTDSVECGAGLHCALENGAGVCRTETTSDTSTGTAVSGAACNGAADCASGLECNYEQGGGICRERTSTGTTTVTGACVSNTDCGAGMLCDFTSGTGACRAATVQY